MQNLTKERIGSGKLYGENNTGGDITTNRTFNAGKTGRTGGFAGVQPSAWKEQHMDPVSIESTGNNTGMAEKR